MISLNHYLILSSILFSIGVVGVLVRRNVLVVLMAIELMLNGVNISFIAFAHFHGSTDAHVFTLFVMAVAAAEAAIGLAVISLLYRQYGTLDIARFTWLREKD